MNRRGFLKAMLATSSAAFVVTTAGVLMPVRKIITPAWRLYGDGVTDDSAAMQAWIDGHEVLGPDWQILWRDLVGGRYRLVGGRYRIAGTIYMSSNRPPRLMRQNTFIGPVKDQGPMFHLTDFDTIPIRDGYLLT